MKELMLPQLGEVKLRARALPNSSRCRHGNDSRVPGRLDVPINEKDIVEVLSCI